MVYYRLQGKVMFSWASVCPQGSRVSLVPCPFCGVGYPGGRVSGSRVSGGRGGVGYGGVEYTLPLSVGMHPTGVPFCCDNELMSGKWCVRPHWIKHYNFTKIIEES